VSEELPALDMVRITAGLHGLPIGSPLRYLPVVDSTNRVARRLSLPHGAAVVTDFQSAGRGRQDRSWQAPPKSSLLVSVVLRIPPNTSASDLVTIGALAVADAVADEAGLDVALKWPNDILVAGRKLCGILAEHDSVSGGVVIGIGLNVNFVPDRSDPLTAGATSIQAELGHIADREAVVVSLFTHLNLWYRMLTEHADAVHEAWVARLAIVGKQLEVHDNTGTWDGVAVAVGRDGSLAVRDQRGEIRPLYAADVSIRGGGARTEPDQRGR
jgi:BirA family biotin operon repressor/biotin-[acetyl-CoA-carboxylase] ligase